MWTENVGAPERWKKIRSLQLSSATTPKKDQMMRRQRGDALVTEKPGLMEGVLIG